MKKIKRLLIANRGEIACRIVATCRAMGIETVTVFADDDRNLPHAYAGDVAVALAGNNLSDTYLNIEKMIAAAKESGADAVHPGYGFLSENADFAEAVTNAGLIFVGPPASVIRQMGDKVQSRLLCQAIHVPTVPGYDGAATDMKTLAMEAERIGFPLLVKAAAGGGGKGMRMVSKASELPSALASAQSEAQQAFGDDRLLMEKYLIHPRHIEVQVFSDGHGHHVHLFERECSIQRRYQKIVEECPAPQLSAQLRAHMVTEAIKITAHIGYVGAGTVEFMVDRSGAFYFLEMNTRLQVEHAVTEMVTGLDLVQMQIEVAQGEKLRLSQAEVMPRGHAMEVRLYAEDVRRDFMPAPGVLHTVSMPHLPHVRCENGYASRCSVSPRYDPMIAKISSWGNTRTEAIRRLLNALSQTRIAGVTHNRAFLMKLLRHPAFAAGDLSTDFIAQHRDTLFNLVLDDEEVAALIAAYILMDADSIRQSDAAEREHSAWVSTKNVGLL